MAPRGKTTAGMPVAGPDPRYGIDDPRRRDADVSEYEPASSRPDGLLEEAVLRQSQRERGRGTNGRAVRGAVVRVQAR